MVTTSTAPTPEEIEDSTAEIRKGWNEREFQKRSSIAEETWKVPILQVLGDTYGLDV